MIRISYNNGMGKRWNFKVGRSLKNLGRGDIDRGGQRWQGDVAEADNEDHTLLAKIFRWPGWGGASENTSISLPLLVKFCHTGEKTSAHKSGEMEDPGGV